MSDYVWQRKIHVCYLQQKLQSKASTLIIQHVYSLKPTLAHSS